MNRQTTISFFTHDSKSFDSLDTKIVSNELFEAGVQSDHLNLIYSSDSLSKVAVKTPVGITDRVDMEMIVSQGETIAPLKCTVTCDSIARKKDEYLAERQYLYKGEVNVPILGMVDDQCDVANCGLDSALAASHLNCQTNISKLQFGHQKCHVLHVGKMKSSCPSHYIDTWSLKEHLTLASAVLKWGSQLTFLKYKATITKKT